MLTMASTSKEDIEMTVSFSSSQDSLGKEFGESHIKEEINYDVGAGVDDTFPAHKEENLLLPFANDVKPLLKSENVAHQHDIQSSINETFLPSTKDMKSQENYQPLNDDSTKSLNPTTVIEAEVDRTDFPDYKCEVSSNDDAEDKAMTSNPTLLIDTGTILPDHLEQKLLVSTGGDQVQNEQKTVTYTIQLFKCDLCGKSFPQKSKLKEHLRVHTKVKFYHCGICKKSFTQRGNLTAHQKIHDNEKPYKCEICDRSFTFSSSLKRHVRVHTNEKPYQCGICKKSFSQGSYLTVHQRIHNDIKPFQCGTCNRSFTSGAILTKHVRVHTKEKPYQCGTCKKSFSQNYNLNRHQLIHSKNKIN